METQTLISAVFHHLVAAFLLFLVFGGCPRSSPFASCSALPSSPHHSAFSPLLKALSEQGGSTWTPDLKRRYKPEHRYVKYMSELYKRSKRVERSSDGNDLYNTIRLIKPLEECLLQNEELFMQDLSYNLDRVRNNEKLLKSLLLYSSDHGQTASITPVCYLNIKGKDNSNQCPLCPGVEHIVNFTVNAGGKRRVGWVEVDVTSVLQPLMDYQKKDIHLLINLTCTEDQVARAYKHKGSIGHTLRSPPLLLYLSDTSKSFHQRSPIFSDVGQNPSNAANTFDKTMEIQPERRIQHKRRLRRESVMSIKEQSENIQQPEPLPSSAFPSDCALYDFRVRFSQLKLDHWIVFPPKYNPRYCRGICSRTMGSIYGSPIHTMVQSLIYELLDSSVPKPSCIPSHYEPLSVMIFEEDGSYMYKEFQDMVATGCTCR
ncbi:growth/differentiation factor 9 [Lampris incognitus]|uniref:growth/differentiation factor 9 n=1 Tax=Lampris incognitus TaxID=2546036 RepID=UPI0024B4FC1A|nr:growth/differentiation factor 9 [Lampris incognitus]